MVSSSKQKQIVQMVPIEHRTRRKLNYVISAGHNVQNPQGPLDWNTLK